MGLQEQSFGEILINNNQTHIYHNDYWFSKISYAPPSVSLFKGDLEQNISFNARNSSIDEAFKVVNLDFLNSEDDLKKFFSQDDFSEGQLQRIGLARAIAKLNSQIIVLDEPTSALDNINKKLLIKKLKQYKENRLVILATHDLELLKHVDKIVIFSEGKIEEFMDFDSAISQSEEFARLQDA